MHGASLVNGTASSVSLALLFYKPRNGICVPDVLCAQLCVCVECRMRCDLGFKCLKESSEVPE
eukprot:7937569-Prorocentrum_lima.AAC.1